MADSKWELGPIGCFAVMLCFGWWVIDPTWDSKLRYSIQYGVPYASVTMLKKPHNCDFLTAPIGNKTCHYEAEVASVRVGMSTEGKPILSHDEGKTWTLDESVPRTKASAYVSWKKVDEDEN